MRPFHFILKMTTAQVVETSATTNNNSLPGGYSHPDDHSIFIIYHFYFCLLVLDPESGQNLLRKLILFLSGTPEIGPYDKIKVAFLEQQSKELLEADACFNKLFIPLTHMSYENFKKSCVTSLSFGGVGYGRF